MTDERIAAGIVQATQAAIVRVERVLARRLYVAERRQIAATYLSGASQMVNNLRKNTTSHEQMDRALAIAGKDFGFVRGTHTEALKA